MIVSTRLIDYCKIRCITTTKLHYTADMNMMTKKGYVSQMDL